MSDRVDITRSIELDLEPDEVWELIGDGERWADWMVDAADVDVVPGGDWPSQRRRRASRRPHRDRRRPANGSPSSGGRSDGPTRRRQSTCASSRRTHGTVLEVVETFPARSTAIAMSAAVARWRARVSGLHASRRMLVAA